MNHNPSSDVSIVLCGEAGQGIQTIEHALNTVLKEAGFHVFSTKEFMSRIRGGMNSTQIRVASHPVSAFIDRTDICIPLKEGALDHLGDRISEETIILGEKDRFAEKFKIHNVPITQIAKEAGGKIYANSVAVGAVLGMLQIDPELYKAYFKHRFASKSEEIVHNNVYACDKGYEIGETLDLCKHVLKCIEADQRVQDNILIDGAESVALGAIAGGCNFVSSYPMSPSTAVLVNAAKYSHDFELAVEQAEDEISAINMALGAWYVGARALVTTSGGGFALMEEGISLAGMIETPVVVHLAQRPGPATGLPTRTGQEDLNLVLYSGHGEFPRIILTPGSMHEAFSLTQQAFNLADQFQVPVFILTDQFLMDSSYNTAKPEVSKIKNQYYIVQTEKSYQRYRLTENGLSPRGIPGYGEGIVAADSDEHTESGYITEDLHLRTQMVDKRLKKINAMQEAAIPPVFIGKEDYETLIVCWGTTYLPLKEALVVLDDSNIAMLHFPQVYPVPINAGPYLEKASKIIVAEGNATGQFRQLLSTETGISIHDVILKYNGMPFSVEDFIEIIQMKID